MGKCARLVYRLTECPSFQRYDGSGPVREPTNLERYHPHLAARGDSHTRAPYGCAVGHTVAARPVITPAKKRARAGYGTGGGAPAAAPTRGRRRGSDAPASRRAGAPAPAQKGRPPPAAHRRA